MWNATLPPADFLKKSFAGMIVRLMPNGTAPLFALSSMLGTGTALQMEHGYFSKTMIFPSATVNAAGIAADTTLTVVSSANLLPGMVLRIPATSELIIVNSVTNATTIVVTRAVGTVAAGAVALAAVLYQVGNAYEEGSVRPVNQYILPVRVTNYTQIFRNSWSLTGTALETQVIAGDTNVAENRQECAAFHAADIEKALFWEQKFLGTRNNQPFHKMDGLINVIATYAPGNITTAAATTNYTQLEAMLDPVFNQATDPKVANERVLFVGGKARVVLNNIGRLNGTYQIMDGQTSYGLQFSTIKISRGTFRMIEHPLFNSNPTWSQMAVAVDLSSFKLVYLGNRKTQSKEYNLDGTPVDNGIDAVGGTLTTEVTTEIKVPSANGVIYGLTLAAKDP
jgi:hypothetical protein